MTLHGINSSTRAWEALGYLDGPPTRVSASAPVAPVALWHFDRDLADEIGGYTLAVTAGTIKYVPVYPGLYGAFIDNDTYLTAISTPAGLRITGDKTITILGSVHEFPAASSSRGVLVGLSSTSSTEANNTLYSLGIYEGGTYWRSEHGSSVSDTAELQGKPQLHTLSVWTVRISSGALTVWVDGFLQAGPSSAITTPTGGNTAAFVVGAEAGGTLQSCSTMLSLAVYDSALSDADILSQAQACLASTRHL